MKCKKIIGLTGSIATGKSTVARLLSDLGYQVVDADRIGHELMEKGNANYQEIVTYFGDEILSQDGQIDRNKLGQIVFSSEQDLKLLNKISHKNIFHKINDIIEKSQEDTIFVELPLLIELKNQGKLRLNLDEIWLVYVNQDLQLERLIKRNGFTEDEAIKRIKSQLSVEEKKEHADFVLYNDKDVNFLKTQILKRLEIKDESTD
ncbi:MAG: dephospho-CoA kinase [Tissierellia bacterium]|nr:dephospho-CoA kinase [Tissierellia bacterium]